MSFVRVSLVPCSFYVSKVYFSVFMGTSMEHTNGFASFIAGSVMKPFLPG